MRVRALTALALLGLAAPAAAESLHVGPGTTRARTETILTKGNAYELEMSGAVQRHYVNTEYDDFYDPMYCVRTTWPNRQGFFCDKSVDPQVSGRIAGVDLILNSDENGQVFPFSSKYVKRFVAPATGPLEIFTPPYDSNQGTEEWSGSGFTLTLEFVGELPKCRGLTATIVGDDDVPEDVIRIVGTPGKDVIVGTRSDDLILGGGGTDLICAGGGSDIVNGGGDADGIYGQGGNDRLIGGVGSFDDIIEGGSGDDTLRGGAGSDRLFGQAGDDTLDTGDDALGDHPNKEHLDGGAGNDVLIARHGSAVADYSQSPNPVHVTLRRGFAGGWGRDILRGVLSATGSRYDDILEGNDNRNMLRGGPGDDDLFGHGRNDLLYGGGGSDHAKGGAGNDLCAEIEHRTDCER